MKNTGAWGFAERMELKRNQLEFDAQQKTELPVVFAATSQDKRVIDLVAFFNSMDERGRITLMRMAQVMPKNDSTKEICK